MQPPTHGSAASEPAALCLRDVVVEVPGPRRRDPRRRVLDGVGIEVRGRELVAAAGSRGFGGTTLLRVVAGLVAPDKGNVLVAGRDVTGKPPAARSIGLVPAGGGLLPHLTVEKNIGYGLRLRDVAAVLIRTRVDEAVELLELRSSLRLRPHELSPGQRLRTALARAVVTTPRVLLVDGTAGSAPLDEVLSMLERLRRGHGFGVLLGAYRAELDRLCAPGPARPVDRIVAIAAGRVEEAGRVENEEDGDGDHPA